MDKDLQREIEKADFDKTELRNFYYGGQERYELIKSINSIRREKGGPYNPGQYDMSRQELIGYTIRKSVEGYFKPFKSGGYASEFPFELLSCSDIQMMGVVGALMTSKLIDIMTTDEQRNEWLPRMKDFTYIASYGQTELGHGSDVQNLKTVATYDEKTQEFTIHTPSIDAVKWWPGELGVYGNFSLVIARLVLKGKDHGVFPFFVQIRDLDTHQTLPGVEAFDIGPKLGYHFKDNGALRFTHYKVPKKALLAKYHFVNENGDLVRAGNPRVLYSAMMEARIAIIAGNVLRLQKSILIGTRYSILRKQFTDSTGREIPVLEYQTQAERIAEYATRAVVMNSAVFDAVRIYGENDNKVKNNDFSMLQDLHIKLCCFKSMFTEWATYGTVAVIRACGGHGFSNYSGLPMIFHESFSDLILEGENTLLRLQVGKYLIKSFKNASSGKTHKLDSSLDYMVALCQNGVQDIPVCKNALSNIDTLLRIFRQATFGLTQKTAMKIAGVLSKGTKLEDALNYHAGSNMNQMAFLHTISIVLSSALQRAKLLKCQKLSKVYDLVFRYFACQEIQTYAAVVAEGTGLSSEHFSLISEIKLETLELLRPSLLSLAEGVSISDGDLFSAIASSDGNPYEKLYTMAKTYSTLNHYPDGVHPAIKEYYLPFRKERMAAAKL